MKQLLILWLWCFPVLLSAKEYKASFDSASVAYERSEFERAAELWENVAASGYESGELYFNLGNSYYKMDQIGKAILNYERALKFMPNDEDVQFNLQLANQHTSDKIETVPDLFLDQWWQTVLTMHSEARWSAYAILCFFLAFASLLLFLFSSASINRLIGFWSAVVLFLLTALTFFIARSAGHSLETKDRAVIMATSAEIRNAPADNGTKLFLLHEGTVVSTPDSSGGWVKIELTPEKVGWIKKESIAFI